jgi:4-hydroxy-tetrahydrodipicolinate synthase
MEKKVFKGVIPPILTIFDGQGHVDEDLQRAYVEFLIEKGVHGIFICGTFGCGIMMTVEEHKRTAQICIEQAKGRADCIVHVGSTNTDISKKLAQNAQEVGADAVSAVPPFYYKFSKEAVIAHFAELVKSVDVPVFTYNNPETTGFNVTPDVILELAHVGVKGMKDTGPMENFYLMMTRMEKEGLDFQFIMGKAAHWLPAALMGVNAMVEGSGNIFPEVVVEMYETSINEGVQAAAELQKKVVRLRDIQLIGGKILSTMAVLELRGISAGYPKKPFQPLNDSIKQRIRDAVIEEGLANIIVN